MAFAQLVYPSTPQAGQVLKGIIKVLTGEKNLSNIDGVLTTPQFDTEGVYQSVIRNANNENWILKYPSSLPSDNIIRTSTISSPCINVNRPHKHVRFIIANTPGGFTEPINGSSTVYSNTTNYLIQVQGLSDINTTTGATTNLTYRNNNGSFGTIKKATSTVEIYAINLSWSNTHLYVSSTIGGRTCFHLTAEFDETGPTAYANVAPCLHITGGGATTQLTNQTTATTTSVNVVSLLGCHDPGLSVPANTGIRCLVSASSGSANTVNFNSLTAMGLSSGSDLGSMLDRKFYIENKSAWLPSPLLINDSANGNGVIDATKYSNVLLFVNASIPEGFWADTSGKNYESLNIYNSGLTDYSTILVKSD